MTRKEFLATSLIVPGVLATTRLGGAEAAAAEVTAETGRGPGRGPRQPLRSVLEFVQTGHGDLAKVKAMLAADPALVHARWDWGDGDWESALEGAAHMGRADIVRHLLMSGARVDILTAAMLGNAASVAALVKLEPAAANTAGPHGLPMMFYVGYGGSVAMAEAVAPLLDDRAAQCNRGLHTATLSNHEQMVEWLITNGASDVNTRNYFGKTPLDAALDRKFDGVARVLRAHGGRTSE